MIIYHSIIILFLIVLIYFLTSFSWFSIVLIIPLIIYLCYFIFYCRYSWKLLFFALFIFSFSWIFFSIGSNNKIDNKITDFNVTVVNNKTNYFIVKFNNQKYFLSKNYYIRNEIKTIDCEIDDGIVFKGSIEALNEINNFYDFDFKLFLNSENVNKQIKIKNNMVPKIISHFSIRNSILKYVNNMPGLVKEYTSLLLFQKNDNNEINKIFSQWGIIAILVVSGFHINIFFLFLNKILKFIHNKTSRTIIILSILLFYLYILNWPVAALRAFILILVIFIFKFKKQKADNLSILALTTFLCLILNPLQFYQLGWQLSFGITLLIFFINHKIQNYTKIKRIFLFSIIIFLFNIPVQLMINHGFSLFSSVYNIIFSPIIIGYYFMLFINLIIFPLINLNFIVIYLLKILVFLTNFLQSINVWIVGFQPETWMMQMFFLIMFICYFCVKFFNWKLIMPLVINFLLLGSIWINHYDKSYYEINMINVGNAMSILVTSPYNQHAILIDAGVEGTNLNSNIIYHYISAKGISTLDAVFLTHKDSDHTNNFNYLNKHLTIKKLFHNENIAQSYYLSDFGKITNLSYSIAKAMANNSENNRSLVLLFNLFNFKFMITGDIEATAENLLLAKGKISKVDFLQIAHHGSKTSSTLPFLKATKPEVAIISGHYQKLRQFPNSETLKKLDQLKIPTFWTGKNKTIAIKIFQHDYQVITLE